MQHQPPIVRWSMPLVVAGLIILCVLPASWLRWTDWFAAQARVVVSPIAHPMTMARSIIIPSAVSDPNASARERALRDELERTRTLLQRERRKTTRLTRLVDDLSRGAALTPEIEVTQIERPVIGNANEFMIVRTGSAPLVERSTVAVVDAVQLCGRVAEAGERTSLVLPFNARSAEAIMGVVMLDPSGERTARCLLRPVGDGSLRGDVTPPEGGELDITTGMEVRLLDDQWPRHAQMLRIGIVERVTSSPEQPLRKRITVRPTVDLRTVPSVIFRVPDYNGEGSP